MTKYLLLTPIGFCLTETDNPEKNNWIKFEGSHSEIADIYYDIVDNLKVESYKDLLGREESLVTDQKFLFEMLKEKDWIKTIDLDTAKNNYELRNVIYSKFSDKEKEDTDSISKIYSSLIVQRHTESRDVFIGQSIHAVDDITKTINLFSNRINEWYGLHFPELIQTTSDIPQLFKFIEQIGDRDQFDSEKLLDITEKKRKRIIELSENSLGVEIGIEDLAPIQTLARQGLDLIKTRGDLEKYIEITATNIMPNVCALVGPLIASRLLAYSGSLLNLAKLPASTVQLLGAEKALFRHLKSGEKPPKHGIIFQSAAIHTAPYHQRGKIARALAGKLSIAARIDYFTGENQTSKLESEFKKRVEDIEKKYPKPPIRPKKPLKPAFKGKDRRQKRPRKGGDKGYRDKRQRKRENKPKKNFKDRSKK
jgi:nucleolar protein 56